MNGVKHFVVSMICGLMAMSGTMASAAEPKMPSGGATLPHGTWAVSLNTGFSSPTPIGYNLNLDYGATDCLQVGLTGSYLVVTASGGISAAYDLLCNPEGAHHLSLRTSPQYLYLNGIFAEIKAFVLDPTLAYEYRWGDDKQTGLFVKAGTQHYYAKVSGDIFAALFDTTARNTTTWAHAFRFSGGIQHQFGHRFSMSAEAGLLTRLRFNKSAPQARLGFTWAF